MKYHKISETLQQFDRQIYLPTHNISLNISKLSHDSLCRDGVDAQYMQQENKNFKKLKRCRDGMPKSMQTRQG